MADELFDGVALAVGLQTAFGTRNATIEALSGSIGSSDGLVRGLRDGGDAESGITIPDLVGDFLEKPAVAASFTESADSFRKLLVEGLVITFAMQGNGATSTPAAGEGKPLAGVDGLLESTGLIGANGTAPVYDYTPRHAGSSGGATKYATMKLWLGDLSFVFGDCLVEVLSTLYTPGGNAIVTATIKVGNFDDVADFSDGVTFPTINYTTQDSLAAPVVEGLTFNAFGLTTGSFEALTIKITNELAEFGDSKVVTTGIRQSQTRRRIEVDGVLYVVTADSDAEYQAHIATVAPTADLSFQLGTVATATDTLNAMLVAVNNLQGKSLKYDRRGDALVAELTGAKATGLTAGSEYTLTYN